MGRTQARRVDDDVILQKALASRNAAKFTRLWSGDTSDYAHQNGDGTPNEGHSEADLALCRELAFYTQDAAQIDRLFRQSALYREKWERADYRDGTITRAIKSAPEHWRGVSAEHHGQADDDAAGDEYHAAAKGDMGDEQQETGQEPHEDEKYKPIEPYLIKWNQRKGTALFYRKPGTTDDQILANFMAWIIEERLEDDGAEPVRMVKMDATLVSGKRFPEIHMPVPEFYTLAGILKALGTEAVVSPGPMVKDRIRHAIQLFSNRQTYPQRHVFTHLGWRKVDGVWCYLHAGGSIPGKAEVSVDKALQRYVLPHAASAPAASSQLADPRMRTSAADASALLCRLPGTARGVARTGCKRMGGRPERGAKIFPGRTHDEPFRPFQPARTRQTVGNRRRTPWSVLASSPRIPCCGLTIMPRSLPPEKRMSKNAKPSV